ncbi:MAG: antibiotic biosynthesis monooxygenase [Pseudomonadota bacterium]
MVRVVYRWRVANEDFPAFREAWQAATNRIHETVPGALGSFMLRAFDDQSEVITIAKWTSREAWERFWDQADPRAMRTMRTLGERLSAELFEEIEDYTR